MRLIRSEFHILCDWTSKGGLGCWQIWEPQLTGWLSTMAFCPFPRGQGLLTPVNLQGGRKPPLPRLTHSEPSWVPGFRQRRVSLSTWVNKQQIIPFSYSPIFPSRFIIIFLPLILLFFTVFHCYSFLSFHSFINTFFFLSFFLTFLLLF